MPTSSAATAAEKPPSASAPVAPAASAAPPAPPTSTLPASTKAPAKAGGPKESLEERMAKLGLDKKPKAETPTAVDEGTAKSGSDESKPKPKAEVPVKSGG